MNKITGPEFSQQLRMLKAAQEASNSVSPQPQVAGEASQQTEGVSFSDFLTEKLGEVNKLNIEADNMIQQAVTGGDVNPHNTLIALQKADISFRLLMSVKERLVQSFQEVMRMPIG